MFSKQELVQLQEDLHFLHMAELKKLALRFGLSDKSKKAELIQFIMHFISTGTVLIKSKIPNVSCAQRGNVPPLAASSLMLKGGYKNDLATRTFFKGLIGEHFHFTAFGIDWLNECWMAGNPPIYQEFAAMWQKEYERRKQAPASPKPEWAYINFTQDFVKKYPNALLQEAHEAWKHEREKRKKQVECLLKIDL